MVRVCSEVCQGSAVVEQFNTASTKLSVAKPQVVAWGWDFALPHACVTPIDCAQRLGDRLVKPSFPRRFNFALPGRFSHMWWALQKRRVNIFSTLLRCRRAGVFCKILHRFANIGKWTLLQLCVASLTHPAQAKRGRERSEAGTTVSVFHILDQQLARA